ncbi:MAG TPA: tachylectin-related carbohydrate-binding protein [Kineosporiaceae bacterium]|nr:tachylectin-related carbohydrate-binding protein [Kineosporiaceae bacterium]
MIRHGRRLLPCAAAVVLASSLVWSGAGSAAAAPVSPQTTATGDCPSVGLVAVDARSGLVRQWAGGDRSTPARLGTATAVADGVAGARLVAVDAGTGVLFAVGTDGKLRYYLRDAATHRYKGGTVVGLKWEGVQQLVAAGQGVFYAVRDTGRVLWYQVVDGRWAAGSGTATTLDARPYSALAAGGDGVLYGVRRDDHRLQLLQTPTPTLPTGRWTDPVDTGRTWDDARILGAGDGVLLGVTASGQVRWYRHGALRSGTVTWDAASGTTIAAGLAGYAAVAPVDTGCTGYALPVDRSLLARDAYGHPHHEYPAVDLPVGLGTPVHVVRGGTVASAGPSGLCGLGVVVEATDGGRYVYCHLSVISVAAGATVATGSLLGLSGNTGHSTGPHLHVGLSFPAGTARCPQQLLLAIQAGAPVPALSSLPTTGCFYAGPPPDADRTSAPR